MTGAAPAHIRTAEVMEVRRTPAARPAAEPDGTPYCPNCGERGEWQKCKLICPNARCAVRIILACVD